MHVKEFTKVKYINTPYQIYCKNYLGLEIYNCECMMGNHIP
jgi:hypothetical protein